MTFPLLAALLPLLVQTLPQAAQAPGDPSRTHHGLRGELEVEVPRLDGAIVVDGMLDEGVWGEAAVLTGFSQYSPQDGIAARDSTEVLVWYSHDAIHFGIRAFAAHARVNVSLPDRDRIQNDDHVQILLDPFNDGRRALVFGVNPLGVQADGVRTEAQTGGGSGLTATREADPVDLSPDFIFESRGRVTDGGYEVEIRIPFQSLRFPNRDEQTWGLQIIRRVQNSGETQTWTPALRGRASFLAQGGRLRGIRGIQGGRVLDLNPVATALAPGTRGAGGWEYESPSPEVGLTATWGITPNLSVSGTANPDFSQVESDAGQLSFDPRRAVFFPEKRPFFLEGSERFQVPNRLIYTRRIVSPDAAVKLAGKAGEWDVGLLSARDARSASPLGAAAWAQIARVQRDVGAESTVGLVYTDRQEGAFSNRVLGADGRLILGERYTLALQGATSGTRRGEDWDRSWLWDASLRRRGRALGFQASVNALDPGFTAANGFISRTDQLQARFSLDHTLFGEEGARVQSWTRGAMVSGNWLREGFFQGERHIEDWKFHASNDLVLQGGWRLGMTLLWERFYFPPYLYSDYALERTVGAVTDTVPFTGTPAIYNYDVVVRLATPRYPRFTGNVTWIGGRDENFDEWAPAWIHIVNAGVEWRPDERIRVEPTYLLQHYIRPDDWSTVSVRNVPRLKLEYQATRAIFLRMVGQYDARYRDALRDDGRTGHPILIRNRSTGIYQRTTEVRRNAVQMDWLFSFQPGPGTVVFVGYGSSLSEPEAFRFREVSRNSDQFFVKLSWLLRM